VQMDHTPMAHKILNSERRLHREAVHFKNVNSIKPRLLKAIIH
jgi:hypothetical protein